MYTRAAPSYQHMNKTVIGHTTKNVQKQSELLQLNNYNSLLQKLSVNHNNL